MLSIIYPFIFFFGILFIAETTPTQEDKQETNIKTIYIINVTGKKIRAILGWCTVINLVLLFLHALVFVFAHDRIYALQQHFIPVSVETFNMILLITLTSYKGLVFVL